MKSAAKLLNLLTAFLAVIGICAASLVCFIVAYTQINGGFPAKQSHTQNISAVQADNRSVEVIPSSTNYDDALPTVVIPDAETDTKIIDNYNNTESIPSTNDFTPSELYEQPAFEYDTNSTTAETNYTTDLGTYDTNLGTYDTSPITYTAPIDQGTGTALPFEPNEANVIYSSEIPIDSSNQLINDSLTAENNFNAYDATAPQVSTPATDTVWLSETGEKYHSIDHCGRMNPEKATLVSLDYAVSTGHKSCDKCF